LVLDILCVTVTYSLTSITIPDPQTSDMRHISLLKSPQPIFLIMAGWLLFSADIRLSRIYADMRKLRLKAEKCSWNTGKTIRL